jgi:mannosyl-oligosaccharide alpha-1,2-mannosidase
VYRDWGHRIMMKIERFCRLKYGYGALPDVRNPSRVPDDRMESFFLAETLKYLFLLQDPDSEINLDEWVFNTEAHPTRVFPPGWRQELGI